MQILKDLLDVFVEVAVVNAMNVAASAFSIQRPPQGTDALKEQLIKLVRGHVSEDGTVTLALDSMASVRVAPFYAGFGGAWMAKNVQEATTRLIKDAPVLQGVKFELKMTYR